MRELGPNEGMNALRHPDCRFCDEYERLIRGVKVERDQLKERQALLQRERDEIKAERDSHWDKLGQAHAGLEDMAESVYPPAAQDARDLLAALDADAPTEPQQGME